jgi:hypothetical protein
VKDRIDGQDVDLLSLRRRFQVTNRVMHHLGTDFIRMVVGLNESEYSCRKAMMDRRGGGNDAVENIRWQRAERVL